MGRTIRYLKGQEVGLRDDFVSIECNVLFLSWGELFSPHYFENLCSPTKVVGELFPLSKSGGELFVSKNFLLPWISNGASLNISQSGKRSPHPKSPATMCHTMVIHNQLLLQQACAEQLCVDSRYQHLKNHNAAIHCQIEGALTKRL